MFWKNKTQSTETTNPNPEVEEKEEGVDNGEENAVGEEEGDFVCDDVSVTAMFGPFVKNYTSALARGQQMSRIPYPFNFYFPNSSLQHQATIQMSHIDFLLEANTQTEPLARFLGVLQYALSTCSLTKFPYKPLIAFIGETAHHHVTHSSDDHTYFLGEQLSRDPPINCFYINNPSRGVTHAGSLELSPKFNKTTVLVEMKGEQKTTLVDPQGRWNEDYIMESPDVAIRLFRMITELSGPITITCPKNNITAVLTFKDKPIFGGKVNVVVGKITMNNKEVATLDGIWDEVIRITDSDGTREFFNKNTIAKRKLEQPESVPPTAGHIVWAPLIHALVEKDYKSAKTIKDKIDADIRSKEPAIVYFRKEGDQWNVIDPASCQNPLAGADSA